MLIFLGSLALASASSAVLAGAIDRVGARFRLSEGLMGLLTAFGANSPEISTAIVSILSRNQDLGVGVILGSNLFNLATLLGLSAVISGELKLSPQSAVLNGAIAIAISLACVAVVFQWIPARIGFGLTLLFFLPYGALLAIPPGRIPLLRSHKRAIAFLRTALERTHQETRKDRQPRRGGWTDVLVLVPSLASTVLGSIGMVHSAVRLSESWGIPSRILGVLILSALTGLPNVIAALRLACRGRGSAVVSEALNSNSLNLVFGISLPVVLLGENAPSSFTKVTAWWFVAMTLASIGLLLRRRQLSRREGAGLLALYAGFVLAVFLL